MKYTAHTTRIKTAIRKAEARAHKQRRIMAAHRRFLETINRYHQAPARSRNPGKEK